MKICVLLTQWKRNNLEKQLASLYNQTIKLDKIIVFQNENHVDIEHLKQKFHFIHVKSDYNTKYFGRFAYLFAVDFDIGLVLDDDVIPGSNSIKNYVTQCLRKNAIIGGNGRFGLMSKNNPNYNNGGKLIQPPDVGIRKGLKVDFVGHIWCFKKEWLHYMFTTKPFTYDTGEDMHFCFSSKIYGNIESYVAEQNTIEDCGDIAFNKLATDQFSSYLRTPQDLRKNVEKYWLKLGLNYITEN